LKDGWSALDLANKFKLAPLDDKMERVDGTALNVEEFQEKYEAPRIPCVITGLTRNWKAHENWTIRKLAQKYGNVRFKCGERKYGRPVMLKFKYYAEYMRENDDDSPLYIFDDSFGERKYTKKLLSDYEVPLIFRDNLFEILGTHEKRPQYRWIVIGPARSGTNIHVDPLGTSAWNALIHDVFVNVIIRNFRWVLIHPDTPKELLRIPKSQRGIHPKEAITWFSTVYKRIHDGDWPFHKYPVIECQQRPGEVIFVPCGWWHVVINEDDTVAVTENFCSRINLVHVYSTILKFRPGLTRIFLKRYK
uniref:JmjC domain-containing protein n=1 Tax=Angiostrongylus cantonensis TaxID=6313 RepID=A0A0K0D2A4_ANGCA